MTENTTSNKDEELNHFSFEYFKKPVTRLNQSSLFEDFHQTDETMKLTFCHTTTVSDR